MYVLRAKPGKNISKAPTGTDTVRRYRCGGGGLLNAISESVQTGDIIRVHMFIKYG